MAIAFLRARDAKATETGKRAGRTESEKSASTPWQDD